ncbi:MAG: hypothetical protein ACLR8Y_03710 [Alistipes indistinctus]
MVMVCGGGILPLIQGGVADPFGYMASYWVVFACPDLHALLRIDRLQERQREYSGVIKTDAVGSGRLALVNRSGRWAHRMDFDKAAPDLRGALAVMSSVLYDVSSVGVLKVL